MSWNWSHTDEGMRTAENNLRALDDETLIEVYAEWSCAQVEQGQFVLVEKRMPAARETARSFINNGGRDIIEDAIWDRAANNAVCDNGGYNAWICPFGCHTVSFSFEIFEGDDDDDIENDMAWAL